MGWEGRGWGKERRESRWVRGEVGRESDEGRRGERGRRVIVLMRHIERQKGKGRV